MVVLVFAQESDIKTIDDEDHTSSKYSDMFQDFETVTNAVENAQKGVTTTKTTVKFIKTKKAGNLKKLIKGSLKGLVFKYKSAKMGPLSILKQIQEKVSEVLHKVDDRINMWRNTLPTLKAYAKTSKRLADNTVQVFKEFEIQDLVDIDREWNRKMESSVLANYRCFYSFGRWMSAKYYRANAKDIEESNQKKYDMVMYTPEELQNGICYNETVLASNLHVLNTMHIFNNLPKTTLMNGAEALHYTERILSRSYDYNDEGNTHQQAVFDSIAVFLNEERKTLVDDQNISAYINQKRAEVEIQNTELEQILTNITVQYSRLLMRNKERQALSQDKFNADIKKLVGDNKLKSYEKHRKEIFKDL
jgi:hypothetical protein